jgi:hypothetical protein
VQGFAAYIDPVFQGVVIPAVENQQMC